MPLYVFSNKQGKIKDFFFSMSEAPSIGREIEIEGKMWKRIPHSPNAVIDAQLNPFDTQKQLERTYNDKQETIGGLCDRAKELSEKRKAKNDGKDPIQKEWFNKYAKERNGKQHWLDKD